MNSDRTIDAWGRVILDPSKVADLLMRGVDPALVLYRDGPDLEQFNQLCRRNGHPDRVLSVVSTPDHPPDVEHARRSATWFTPEPYASMDVRALLDARCDRDDERARVHLEMDLFEARGLLPVLRVMIWLVDVFRQNNVVWGIGRGSSVASYCLFLLGVHKIDSIRYGLSITEFLK